MIRGLAKGAALAAFGTTGPTARLYRTVTREWMGSQATHVDKLRRVWPGYVDIWRSRAGVNLDGADIWIYEGGWTPFPFFANLLVTGKAGTVTNRSGRMLDRYLGRAVNGAISCALPEDLPLAERRPQLESLRWAPTVHQAIATIAGELHEGIEPSSIPLGSDSIDLCHSGGTLEHYRPDDIRAFLGEAMRILRPGAAMSHVFDHRDHLHHADESWPYLAHYGISPQSYRVLSGGPLLFHNRLLPRQVADLFEEAGFERVVIRRMMLPSKSYVDDGTDMADGVPGIERSKLAASFRQATDADLRTAAARYLYRKPG